MSKEMLGGCCVCSDERGWTENPLVYCDGQGCTVAVHQACYGIVTVPTGPWFCRKCESQERAARVRCELCPSKDGALKRTDNNGWAHVVCALYIPEVRFGNVTTMEPIILQLIPAERYNKICYICQEQGKGTKSTIGACMQCNKTGCKQQFHVTCAQALGLLCEEAGNYLDNVKYCGYCQHHYSKLVCMDCTSLVVMELIELLIEMFLTFKKKGGNVKTIPPYKPITSADNGSSDSSPEKESEALGRSSSGKKKSYLSAKSVTTGAKSKSPNPSPVPDGGFGLNTIGDSDKDRTSNGDGVILKIGTTTSHLSGAIKESSQDGTELKKKFTTSNFTETIVTESEPVFGADSVKTTEAPMEPNKNVKKRKTSTGNVTSPIKTESLSDTTGSGGTSTASNLGNSTGMTANMKNPTVSITNLKSNILSSTSKNSMNVSGSKTNLTVTGTGTKITISAQRDVDNKGDSFNRTKTDSLSNLQSGNSNTSVNASTTLLNAASANPSEKLTESQDSLIRAVNGNHVDWKPVGSDIQPAKRARSSSSDKNKKNKRNQNIQPPKRSGRASSGSAEAPAIKDPKESPPGSPDDSRKGIKKKVPAATTVIKTEEKDLKPFQNAMSVPHMLGNQLNPNSSMAQKMHDALNQEVEAHSIYTSETNSNLIGPQLHSKVVASARASNVERNANSASLSAANSLLSLGNPSSSSSSNSTSTSSSQGPTQAQSLEQLLERQWEQGSQFLMEQAQHFDIASLLSCLHQLKAENLKLEEHVNSLLQRRDHLLAVNARLAVPLNTQPTPVSQTTTNPQNSNTSQQNANINRQQFIGLENGLPSESSQNFVGHGRTTSQSSPTIRHNPSIYPGQTGNIRSTERSAGPMDSNRRGNPSAYQGYPPSAQVPIVTSPSVDGGAS
ncbi:hypothetical protein RUM44_001933 [Polyplax serrata]|uniref:Protein AF-10 n=1 Tax=Polyplax serrata TaxID=468196 RepID=A0ABR1ALG5_POLSC